MLDCLPARAGGGTGQWENPADQGVVRPAGACAEDTAPQAAQYFPVDPGDRLVPQTDARPRGPADRGRLACPNPPGDVARARASICTVRGFPPRRAAAWPACLKQDAAISTAEGCVRPVVRPGLAARIVTRMGRDVARRLGSWAGAAGARLEPGPRLDGGPPCGCVRCKTCFIGTS